MSYLTRIILLMLLSFAVVALQAMLKNVLVKLQYNELIDSGSFNSFVLSASCIEVERKFYQNFRILNSC